MPLTGAEQSRRYRQRYPDKVRESLIRRSEQIKASQRRKWLKQYGISESEYAEMLAGQGGVCAVCGAPPNGRRLDVDHIHGTKMIRGLLCHMCNLMIGHSKDDAKRLETAAAYIKASQRRNP